MSSRKFSVKTWVAKPWFKCSVLIFEGLIENTQQQQKRFILISEIHSKKKKHIEHVLNYLFMFHFTWNLTFSGCGYVGWHPIKVYGLVHVANDGYLFLMETRFIEFNKLMITQAGGLRWSQVSHRNGCKHIRSQHCCRSCSLRNSFWFINGQKRCKWNYIYAVKLNE